MEMLHTGRTYHDITGLNDTSFFSINSGSAFTTKNSKELTCRMDMPKCSGAWFKNHNSIVNRHTRNLLAHRNNFCFTCEYFGICRNFR